MTNNHELLLKHLESFEETKRSYLFEILPNTPLAEMESVINTIASIDEVIVKLQSQIESSIAYFIFQTRMSEYK